MSSVRKVTNSLNLNKCKNQIFETPIEPVACIVSYGFTSEKSPLVKDLLTFEADMYRLIKNIQQTPFQQFPSTKDE